MRNDRLKSLLTGTLRRQLVFGMVFAVAGMMSLFVWDMTRRQQAVVQEQQSEHAVALARSVSTSAAVWVASRDYSGLQEIIDGLARYPDLQHAIVLDAQGKVLAHSDVARRGLYLSDLPLRPVLNFLGHDAALVDVASPIMLAGNHIGWVRVGLGQQSMAEKMDDISRNGIIYVLIAIALAAVVSTLAARRLTRRLYAIQSVADAVQAGRHELRVDIRGEDEAARLARQFNGMLDTLEKHSEALGQANTALRSEIEQRRDAEDARDRMISVVEVSPDYISMADLDGNVLYLNRGGWAMIGQAERALSELRIPDVHPQWATDIILGQGIPAAIRDGSWVGETALLNGRDGSEIPVSQIILAHRDPQGELLFLSTVMRDISERKKMEETLRQAYGENRAVTQAVRDNLYMLDESGHMAWWNLQVEESTGLDPVALKGKYGPEFFIPDDCAGVEAALRKAVSDGYAEVEARLITPDGPVYYQYNGVPVKDAEGRFLGIAGVGRDISERKRTELALKELNEELEQRVVQRTADMKTAMDAAERANRAKSDFLSSMSHELRTPMNAILGFGQLMEYDAALPGEHRDNVQEILRAGRHLLELINEVLDLARVESGRIDLSLEPVYVLPLVQECQALMNSLGNRRGIRIERGSLQGFQVRADRTRLKQALINLLSNAVKYNREGGSVFIEARPEGNERLRIRVTDTGLGIPAEQLTELFQPFNRLGAENGTIEGTGIGLTITRRIVEMMGGSVEVESEVGVGSTFWIELPLESAPGYEEIHTQRDRDGGASDSAPEQHLQAAQHTVLYIEDNPSNIKLVAQILGHRKHIQLFTAHTPELGIELALARRPELILLDINMPGMDGYQVLEVFKADARLKAIPVIAVTAAAMPSDIERGRVAGFSEYLTKPINIASFLESLDRCLPGRPEKKA